jgi:hypothetical protein
LKCSHFIHIVIVLIVVIMRGRKKSGTCVGFCEREKTTLSVKNEPIRARREKNDRLNFPFFLLSFIFSTASNHNQHSVISNDKYGVSEFIYYFFFYFLKFFFEDSSFFHSDNWIDQTKKEEYDDLERKIKKLERQKEDLEAKNPDDPRIEAKENLIAGYLKERERIWNTFGPGHLQAPAPAAQPGKPFPPFQFIFPGVDDFFRLLSFQLKKSGPH